jgi:predicted esterase
MDDTRPNPSPRRLGVVRALSLSFASVALTLLGFATAFAVKAHVPTWVQLGVSGILVVLALVLLLFPRRRLARRTALVFLLLGLSRVAWAVAPWKLPAHPGALVKTRFVGAPPDTPLWFQGVPEHETVRLGAWTLLTKKEFIFGGAAVDKAYDEIDESDLFERTESPLLDSWFQDREHFWLAVPAKSDKPCPLIVFVHGHGGTFAMYPHLLAREALQRGFAIAFPSYSFGQWDMKEGKERVGRVVEAVSREVPIDRSRIALVGLSGGGPGVMGAALLDPRKYRSVVAVSCVFPEIHAALEGTSVLILHGSEDPRAPVQGARRAYQDLKDAGARVELEEEPGEDHLAFLTNKELWVPRILDWIARR